MTSAEIYTTLTVVTLITSPLLTLLQAIPSLSRAVSSFPRVQEFLCLAEQTDGRAADERYTTIRITNMSIRSETYSRTILFDISLQIQPGNVSMISGPVGCGKTTLLKSIIGELPLQSGFIEVPLTSMAYADQVPWLQNMSIRDNICHGDFNAARYEQVLVACALDRDLAALPLGDQTIIGSGVYNLSGGQKQRVV